MPRGHLVMFQNTTLQGQPGLIRELYPVIFSFGCYNLLITSTMISVWQNYYCILWYWTINNMSFRQVDFLKKQYRLSHTITCNHYIMKQRTLYIPDCIVCDFRQEEVTAVRSITYSSGFSFTTSQTRQNVKWPVCLVMATLIFLRGLCGHSSHAYANPQKMEEYTNLGSPIHICIFVSHLTTA